MAQRILVLQFAYVGLYNVQAMSLHKAIDDHRLLFLVCHAAFLLLIVMLQAATYERARNCRRNLDRYFPPGASADSLSRIGILKGEPLRTICPWTIPTYTP